MWPMQLLKEEYFGRVVSTKGLSEWHVLGITRRPVWLEKCEWGLGIDNKATRCVRHCKALKELWIWILLYWNETIKSLWAELWYNILKNFKAVANVLRTGCGGKEWKPSNRLWSYIHEIVQRWWWPGSGW